MKEGLHIQLTPEDQCFNRDARLKDAIEVKRK